MKKLCLLALLLFGLSACMNNQVVPFGNQEKSGFLNTRSIKVKTVKEYIESNEFIDIIPNEYYSLREKGKMSEEEIKAADYQMKAAAYRFYKHCTMDDKGFITCNATCGKELNISEEVFEFRLRDMKGWNDMIEKNIREGAKYKVIRLDERYFNGLLNYK